MELPARRVTILDLAVRDLRRVADPGGELLDVDLTVRCSSGTYVRAIARDAGAELGVGGHLTALRRTSIGAPGRGVSLDEATTLEPLDDRGELSLIGMDDAARRFFPSVDLDEEAARDVGFGRPLQLTLPRADGPHAVFAPDGRFLALYEDSDGRATAVAVFV